MYNKEKKGMVGHYDGEPISRQYEGKLNQFQKTLGKKPTEAEKVFEERVASLIAEEARTRYVTQKIFYITDDIAFIADFYFPKFKAAVEIDGGSHNGERNRQRDKWRDGLLKEHAGVSVVRFSNKAVLTQSGEVFRSMVRFLGKQEKATPSHWKYLRKVYRDLF